MRGGFIEEGAQGGWVKRRALFNLLITHRDRLAHRRLDAGTRPLGEPRDGPGVVGEVRDDVTPAPIGEQRRAVQLGIVEFGEGAGEEGGGKARLHQLGLEGGFGGEVVAGSHRVSFNKRMSTTQQRRRLQTRRYRGRSIADRAASLRALTAGHRCRCRLLHATAACQPRQPQIKARVTNSSAARTTARERMPCVARGHPTPVCDAYSGLSSHGEATRTTPESSSTR